MYNESICSKLLLNVYGVNKEHISDNEFTINSLICHYIYLEHKEKFIATKLNLDKNCRIKGDEKDDLIGFINLDGVLEKLLPIISIISSKKTTSIYSTNILE